MCRLPACVTAPLLQSTIRYPAATSQEPGEGGKRVKMVASKTGTGRIEAVGVAVEGTQFALSRSDWFAILRAARGHEVA